MNADHGPGPVPAEGGLRPFLKPLIVLTVLTLGLIVVYLSPLRDALQHVRDLKAQLKQLGPVGPIVYMLAVFVLISLGTPRLLLCPIGGMAFGFVRGLLWTQIPTLLGYYVIFSFVRWGGRDFVMHHWPRLKDIPAFNRRGISTVILMRQMPLSGLIVNFILGLSPVKPLDFLLGSVIGILPQAIPFTLVGSSVGKVSPADMAMQITWATVFLVLLWVGFSLFGRYSKSFAEMRGEIERR